MLSKDELLDNVMLYWVTNSATSSARIYWESFGRRGAKLEPVAVPVGVAVYPKEIVPPVRRWLKTDYPDIRHFEVMPKGGHFSAIEQPSLFLDDVRAYFRRLR